MTVVFCGHSTYIRNQQDENVLLEILESTVGGMPCDFFLANTGILISSAMNVHTSSSKNILQQD